MELSDDVWRERLTKLQYGVLRQGGTEAPFSGQIREYAHETSYACAGCGATVFSGRTSFESTTPGLIGWPSFSRPIDVAAVRLTPDYSYGMLRIEVICNNCESHLGHYFDDSSAPENAHYCINSCALEPEAEGSDIRQSGRQTRNRLDQFQA